MLDRYTTGPSEDLTKLSIDVKLLDRLSQTNYVCIYITPSRLRNGFFAERPKHLGFLEDTTLRLFRY